MHATKAPAVSPIRTRREVYEDYIYAYHRRTQLSLSQSTFDVVGDASEITLPTRLEVFNRKREARKQRSRQKDQPSKRSTPRKLTVDEKRLLAERRQAELVEPDTNGFVPRHLRGAKVVVDGHLQAGKTAGWSRQTWRP